MKDEYSSIPNREKLDQLNVLWKKYEFARESYELASNLIKACVQSSTCDQKCRKHSVDVFEFSLKPPFFMAEYVNCGHSQLRLGALGAIFRDDVRNLAKKLLWCCDAKMSPAAGEETGTQSL